MSFSFEEASEELNCPHTNCDYHQVVTEISGTYVEGKLTLQKNCRNCEGRDHLMFEVGDYSRSIDLVSVGDEFKVTGSVMFCRASTGDKLRVTTVAENPLYVGEKTVISFVRNPNESSPYTTGTTNPDRLETLISKGSVEKIDN